MLEHMFGGGQIISGTSLLALLLHMPSQLTFELQPFFLFSPLFVKQENRIIGWCLTMPGFYMGSGGFELGPHSSACMLATELSPLPPKGPLTIVSYIKVSFTESVLMILNVIPLFLIQLGKMVVFENYKK